MDIVQKLQELGWAFPAVAKPVASYMPSVRAGNLLFVSGQLPWREGKLLATGPAPSAANIELAQKAAGQCAVLALAAVGAEIGSDWSRLRRVVRIGVFVQSDPGFAEQPKIANGASDLLQQVLGEHGRHARSAVGVNALPLNATVEVEFIFEIDG
jgi:enamine deaminase RidA (YjgF/YER057c/UK114 family)